MNLTPVMLETQAIYFNGPPQKAISFNDKLISQYGIEGFILYLIFIFIIGTVGSYIVMREMRRQEEQELKEKSKETEDDDIK